MAIGRTRLLLGFVPAAACLALWPVHARTVAPRPQEPPAASRPAVTADGLVYVSGISGAGSAASDDAADDVAVQTRRVLDRMMLVLGDAGSSLRHVAHVTVQLSRAADCDAMDVVYREFFPDNPPARTVIITNMPGGTRVQMAATAVPLGAPREVIAPAGWASPARPYSHAVRAGGLVVLSGLVSRNPANGRAVPGSMAAQAKTILENAETLLESAKLTLGDVVSSRVFLLDGVAFEAVNEEYGRYFPREPPARAMGVTRFLDGDSMVQMTMIASIIDKETIGPLVSPTLPVSAAIRTGNRIFLSGVLGTTGGNRGDLTAQTREAFSRIERTLQSAGASLADVVESTIYLPDPWQQPKLHALLGEFFPRDLPARTVIGAGLVPHDAELELLVTAVRKVSSVD
jgi:2-iminobutanoate/2-iminopropanoate deaminase